MLRKPRHFVIGRNPSYRSSVATGLRLGLWMAPTTFFKAVGEPFWGILVSLIVALTGLAYLALRIVCWAIVAVVLVIAGFTGFVMPVTVSQN